MNLEKRLMFYYITAVLSLISALAGFGYNAWRLEVTEDNNTVRTASFEVLKQLAHLEQIIFTLHYDKNTVEGSPRKGWVAIGLINDLSMLVSADVEQKAQNLKATWSDRWASIETNEEAVNVLISEVDLVRVAIKKALMSLE